MEESKYGVDYNIDVDIYSKIYTLKLFNAMGITDKIPSSLIPQSGKKVANLQEAFTYLIKILSEDKRYLVSIYKMGKDNERIMGKVWRVYSIFPEDIIVFAETDQEAIALAYKFISRGEYYSNKDLEGTEIRVEHIVEMDYLNFYGCSTFLSPYGYRIILYIRINLDYI